MPIGSDAPLQIELALISGGQVIVIPSHEYFRSLQVELVAGGSWTGTLELFDPQGDFLENIVILAGTDRRLRVKFGRGEQYPEENLSLEGNITTYRPLFEPNGITLTVEVVSVGVVSAMVRRVPRSFAEGRLLSDVVTELAALNDWATSDALGRPTIEPTPVPTGEPFTSTGESDLSFIQRVLVPQATNAAGQGNYLFYFDEANAIHFHTPDFLQSVEHTFVYARDMAGDVISFSPADVSLFGVLMGGGNTIFTGLSSLSGASAQAKSTTESGVENEGFPVVSDGSSRVDYGSDVHSYVNIDTRDPLELKRLAQSRFDKFREYAFKADLEIHGSHRVRVLDFVNIRYLKANPLPGSNPEHYLSGRFRVYKIRHEITGDWRTTYETLRGGFEAQGLTPVQATQTISPTVASSSGGSVSASVDTSGAGG